MSVGPDSGRTQVAGPQDSAAEELSAYLQRVRGEHRRLFARDGLIGGTAAVAALIALGILASVNVDRRDDFDASTQPFSWLWLIIPIVVFVVTAVVVAVRHSDRRAQFAQARIDERVEQDARLAEAEAHFESGLKLNRSLLRRYHDLSTQQAHASFRLAHYVMIATAVILLGGSTAAVMAPSTTASVTIAGMAGLASALSGYISSTLIRSYQVAVQQAQIYVREPLAGGYLLSTERLAASLDDIDVKRQAVQQVIDGLVQAAAGVTQSGQSAAPPTENILTGSPQSSGSAG